ncbi:MAG: hypothetical protein ABW220_12925 [Burkholderiaceae bacterium]
MIAHPSELPVAHDLAGPLLPAAVHQPPTLHAVPMPAMEDVIAPPPRPAHPPAALQSLMTYRPLRGFTCDQLDAFMHRSRMVPSCSRFEHGVGRWVVPRRDITVRAAMATLRERLQQGAAMAEVIAQLEREFVDENPMDEDDESVVVASGIRDCLREALGMLGVFEQALTDGVAVIRLGEVEEAEPGDMD